MDSSITLKKLLAEYKLKKSNAEQEAAMRKLILYEKEPELQKIDDEIHSLAFSSTKSLLNSNDSIILENLANKIELLKKKKNDIYRKLNLPSNYLEPQYECLLCKDTGYTTNSDYTSSICNCLKQKLFDIECNYSNISNLQTQTFDNFSEFFYSDKANSEKYHTNISPRDNIKKIKQLCQNFIDNFDSPEEKNLLFTGNTGLGKTFLSSCIANEILKKRKTVLYQTAPILLDTIIDYRFGKSNIDKITYDNFLNADLLIIDDLGTEYMNNIKFTELFNIINARLLNQSHVVKTIISTNLDLNNLYSTYDERIISRIIGNYNICYFFGDDIRIKKR